MIDETTHDASGCHDLEDAFPDCCRGMAEKMAACGPVMEKMMALCMEKMRGETAPGDSEEPSQE